MAHKVYDVTGVEIKIGNRIRTLVGPAKETGVVAETHPTKACFRMEGEPMWRSAVDSLIMSDL